MGTQNIYSNYLESITVFFILVHYSFLIKINIYTCTLCDFYFVYLNIFKCKILRKYTS